MCNKFAITGYTVATLFSCLSIVFAIIEGITYLTGSIVIFDIIVIVLYLWLITLEIDSLREADLREAKSEEEKSNDII